MLTKGQYGPGCLSHHAGKMEGSLIYNMLTMMMEHLEHVGDGIRKAAGIKTPEGPGLSIVK